MCTSLVLFALSGMFAPGITQEPQWSEYADGLQRSERENKPVAVFIGTGKKGWEQLSQEGKLSTRIERQLANSYICVYLDVRTEGELASAFEIDGPGIVISNGGGKLQAFRHEGDLANEDLEHYLARFSDPDRAVRNTEDTQPRQNYYYQPVQQAPVCRS